jgi:hypothetical protein
MVSPRPSGYPASMSGTTVNQDADPRLAGNHSIADRFVETGRLLDDQGANPFRARAYRLAAETLRRLDRPVEEILRNEGSEGLERLPAIGRGLRQSGTTWTPAGCRFRSGCGNAGNRWQHFGRFPESGRNWPVG